MGKTYYKTDRVEVPNEKALNSQLLFSEPKGLNIGTGLPDLKKERFKLGVYY